MTRSSESLALQWLMSYLSPYSNDPILPVDTVCWGGILRAADRGLVLPKLASALLASPVELPSEVLSHLKLSLELCYLRNAELQSELYNIIVAMNKEGVTPVLLKSTGMLFECGAAAKSRLMLDLDIWIPEPAPRARALEILHGLGYAASLPPVEDEFSHHYPSHFKSGALARVELHYRPGPVMHSQFLQFATPVESLLPRTFNEAQYRVLDAQNALMLSYIQCRSGAQEKCVLPSKWCDLLERCEITQVKSLEDLRGLGFAVAGSKLDVRLLTTLRELGGLPFTGKTDRAILRAIELRQFEPVSVRAMRNLVTFVVRFALVIFDRRRWRGKTFKQISRSASHRVKDLKSCIYRACNREFY